MNIIISSGRNDDKLLIAPQYYAYYRNAYRFYNMRVHIVLPTKCYENTIWLLWARAFKQEAMWQKCHTMVKIVLLLVLLYHHNLAVRRTCQRTAERN